MMQKLTRAGAGGRWFRFAYLNRGRHGREILPYQARDGDAALAVQPALHSLGYNFAGPIFNFPAENRRPTSEPQIKLTRNDLIVLTTRPPLHDDTEPGRSNLPRSYTSLEIKVLACMRRHLLYCTRRRVAISHAHVSASEDIARLGNIQFGVNGGARIDAVQSYQDGRWRRQSRDLPDTVAYMVYDPQVWPGGPALFAAWGMSGLDTLAWSFLLSKQYPHLIGKVSFAIAEIKAGDRPKRPGTLAFLHDWRVKIHTSPAGALH